MSQAPDKARILSALKFEWETLQTLCEGLTDEEWDLPSECPGWSVKDNLSHIVGTESFLDGQPFPEVEVADSPHIKNEIAKMNEQWVTDMRSMSGAEVLNKFKAITEKRLGVLEAMEDADWKAESQTPVGPAPYGRFMQIRVLDSWMHEQDIRYAIQKLGNDDVGEAVEVTLDEMELAMGFVVGKLGGASDGTKVEFDITGKSGKKILVQVVDGRAGLVESFDGGSDIKFTTSISTFGRLVGGRQAGADVLEAGKITIESQAGFEETAQNILNNVGYMI